MLRGRQDIATEEQFEELEAIKQNTDDRERTTGQDLVDAVRAAPEARGSDSIRTVKASMGTVTLYGV